MTEQAGRTQNKCTKGRKSKAKTAYYWNFRYPRNMLRCAQRCHRRILKFGGEEAKAREQAQRCASAHGAQVEGVLARWFRGERVFKVE